MAKPAIIPNDHASKVCGLGTTHCCRYFAIGPGGLECLKHSEHRSYIDARVASGASNATEDNCEGFVGEKPGSN